MNLTELKRKNSVSIYQCILNGANSIIPISETTGLSRLAVSDLANELVERGILDMTKPRRNVKGRRIHYFQPSNKYFTAFIDVQSEYICTIGISTAGKVTVRFDIAKNYERQSTQQVLTDFVIKRLKESPNYKYCLAVYLIGNEIDELTVDESIIKTTKEDLIVSAFSDKNKAMLFEFNGKLVVSLYSHTYVPTLDKRTLMKAIPFDEICSYDGNLYFESYDALQRIAMINLEKFI